MTNNMRHPDILARLRSAGKVTVEDLAEQFDVTLQTIRRDLSDLAQSGLVERVHGGAVLPSGTRNIAYEERRQLNDAAKSAIGAACAAQIPHDACLFLGIGTTTEAVARALTGHRGLMVVTNNLNIATLLGPAEGVHVIMTGGALRSADGGLTGPLALRSLEQFSFDIAVLGCSALSPSGEVQDYDMDEIALSQHCLRHARACWLVADASKRARQAPVNLAPLSKFEALYTDCDLTDAQKQQWGLEALKLCLCEGP